MLKCRCKKIFTLVIKSLQHCRSKKKMENEYLSLVTMP